MISAYSGNSAASANAWHSGHRFGDSSRSQRAAQGTLSESQAQRSGSIALRTDDGDTVNISFAGAESLRSDTYQAQSRRGSVAAASSSASAAYAVEVQVNGSLSDQEMADIGKLMTTLLGAVTDARSGNLDGAAQKIASTSSLESLAAYRFAYEEQSSSTSVAALSARG